MSEAPVCNVKGVNLPGSPGLVVLQPIPRATDLGSALKAIQALTNNFNALAGQIANNDLTNGFSTIQGNNTSPWAEERNLRVTKTVRVTNPDDNSQFVDVEQINAFTMKNKKSGELWTWKR